MQFDDAKARFERALCGGDEIADHVADLVQREFVRGGIAVGEGGAVKE